MYNQGFYALFLVISFVLGLVVLLFGFLMRSLFDHKPKIKRKKLTIADFRAKIPSGKTTEEALKLVALFSKKFGVMHSDSAEKQEWLDAIRELTTLESIDTDKAAEIREQLIAKNPSLKKEIADAVGMALKTKKDVR
ncbi:hypothetical protein BKN38_06575 [Helicobacter sp. CLO-3]|uniref:hypothetical protein n=1 Tax=unclassified Helicobacter TaxID=2593540 RepID=UPI000804CC89|nr:MULTISPECIES: hypothetical protein [unclassified Helicobacter]OBV30048.1 hypothetical protein BA723_02885 [Helicobacter sp. CLO-3]OHU82717.1 hypothetical protein BKN38_06575 [Helicobacter sp. CLO-3]